MSDINVNRYRTALRTHLKTLNSLSRFFDSGHPDTAFIMANSLRAIFKNTRGQTSILKLLDSENIRILSTVEPQGDVRGLISYDGLLHMRFSRRASFVAPLGQAPHKEFIPVSDWYEQVVSIHSGHVYSRQSLILCVAENDSGTHVDPKLPKGYETLKSGVWTGYDEKTREKFAIEDLQLLMIRQIVYEVVNSPDIGRLAIG